MRSVPEEQTAQRGPREESRAAPRYWTEGALYPTGGEMIPFSVQVKGIQHEGRSVWFSVRWGNIEQFITTLVTHPVNIVPFHDPQFRGPNHTRGNLRQVPDSRVYPTAMSQSPRPFYSHPPEQTRLFAPRPAFITGLTSRGPKGQRVIPPPIFSVVSIPD